MDTSTHQLPEQAAIVVEYPGYVRNVAKAVQTLGSEETLQNCIEENSTAGVLLRISRKLGDEDAPVKVQVAARVERTYQFNTLSDYQYLPVNDAKVRPRAATAAPTAPATEAPEQQEPFQDMQPLLLVPPLFTRVDVALDYAYKQVKGKPAGEASTMQRHM
jgi:general transcription factor 3C polypeptide 5 (transcription factor C subunit 1)